ncbi:MAG: transcriptional regulator [Planctomycetes bacterium]|nr:transcriptional regulator [Planctomycetota bacterium]
MTLQRVKIDDIDRVIHERARLAIMSALVAADGESSFVKLKEIVGLTDGNLSVHLRILEEAGYVVIKKSFIARRPHTAARLTPAGRKAFRVYVDVLEKVVRRTLS